jgi:hypothetical protein
MDGHIGAYLFMGGLICLIIVLGIIIYKMLKE